MSFRKVLKDKREEIVKVVVFKKGSKGQEGGKRVGNCLLEEF